MGGDPVSVGLAYRSRELATSRVFLEEFLEVFDVPGGVILTGDTLDGGESIAEVADGIVQILSWSFLLLA